MMTDRGLQCVRGGRFVHLMGPNNKARAMEWLQLAIGHYLGGEVVSIGIGDADNDRSLLEATDIALLVRSPVHAFPVLERTDNTFHSRLYGPEGWVEGVETIMTTLLGKEALA
jgi:predicted mannosyl-3-phosphoglycerate phosphatase (HAD superfamily)